MKRNKRHIHDVKKKLSANVLNKKAGIENLRTMELHRWTIYCDVKLQTLKLNSPLTALERFH